MSNLLEMGKYAIYIWPAYGIATVVLVGLLWSSLRTLRARERENKALEAERPRRRARKASGDRP